MIQLKNITLRRSAKVLLHGATVTLTPTQNVHVNLDTMPGLTADVVGRWAPVITSVLPEMREILKARRHE